MLGSTPNLGLKLRKPPKKLATSISDVKNKSRKTEQQSFKIVPYPIISVQGIDLPQNVLSVLNRLQTGHGRYTTVIIVIKLSKKL